MKKIAKNSTVFLIILLIIASLTGCSGTKTVSEKQSKEDTYKKLREIRNEFIHNIWNDVFCDVSHYLYDGKDATGEYFDVDRAIKKADKLMDKKKKYDRYIENLGDEYNEIKEAWEDLSYESEKLYKKIKKEKPTAKNKDYEFSTKRFRNAVEDYDELLKELKEDIE